MKSLLLRAIPLALFLAGSSQPALAQPASLPRLEAPAELTAEQWREDLAFMVAEMRKRHPDLYHSVQREAFDAAVTDLHARIPTLRRNQIIVGLMRIAALVNDGHTRVDPRKDTKFGFPSLPLKLYLFDDGLFVRAAAPTHVNLVGAEIVAFDGVPVSEAIRRTHAISSVDNSMGYRLFAGLYLNMPDILHALKLSPSRDAAILTLRKDGRTWTTSVPAAEVEPLWPPDTDVSLVTPKGWSDAARTMPIWLQAPLDYHRLIPMPGNRALYAQVNMITDIAGQSLTQFGNRVRRKAQATNPGAIVLDFRLSYGGNHDLRHGFIRELVKAEDEDTRLSVLTRRGAFSATEALLVDLDRLTSAVFVGEPASSKPNSFGDAYRTPLPNSGVSIRTSIQLNQLKGQSPDPWTWVDVAAPYRFGDYAAGRDPALEAALRFQPERSLAERLKAAPAADAERVIDAYIADPRHRYANVERSLLSAAETLSAGKHSNVGLVAAANAAKRFPHSHDAQLVHAFLLDRAGRTDAALAAARLALVIDPNSRQGRSLVERLESPKGRQP